MKQKLYIEINYNEELKERILHFFEIHNFESLIIEKNKLIFKKKSSVFDPWKNNPLEWGSKISATLSDKNIYIEFYIDTNAQMKTFEELQVWKIFIENLKNYILTNEYDDSKLLFLIKENRKERLKYLGWVFVGIMTAYFLSSIYNKFTTTNNSYLYVFL